MKSAITMETHSERMLVLSYARMNDRGALAALLALDDALGAILRTTREPMVGQMRLTWWHDALSALDRGTVPAEPVLRALAGEVLPRGVSGAALADLIKGWEILLDPEPLGDDALKRFGRLRGAGLFRAAAAVLDAAADDPAAAAGSGWALADLARHIGDSATAQSASALGRPQLTVATRRRWSRNARALGALAHLARMDLDVPFDRPISVAAPRRIARLAWHRLSGR